MSDFEIIRSATIVADPARVHALVNDFHEWPAWSPWEDIDPSMQRTYTGPDSGVGAHYEWLGNRKAGQGSMEITASTPENIALELVFLKPWRATNQVRFNIIPAGMGAEVTWRMNGEQKGLMAIFGKLFSMDRILGKDFEKGLARLKAAAESSN